MSNEEQGITLLPLSRLRFVVTALAVISSAVAAILGIPLAGFLVFQLLEKAMLNGPRPDPWTTQALRLFVSKGCGSCHAISGDRPAIGPPLARFRQFASPVLWAEIMWKHALEMEQKMQQMGLAWPVFERNEMVDLITYIRSVARSQKP